jgi:hypothetical protein
MATTANWIIGGAIAVMGLVGLFLAARGLDDGVYLFGLGLFAFAILFLFSLIARTVGNHADAEDQRAPGE